MPVIEKGAARRAVAASIAVAVGLMMGFSSGTPGSAPFPSAMADAAQVGVDDITIDAGFGKYVIKHMEVEDSSLSATEIRDLFAGKGDGTLVERLSKLSAKSITVPEMRFDQSMGEIKQSITYRDGKIIGIANGKIGKVTFASAAMSSEIVAGQKISFSMGEITGADVDLNTAARVVTEKSTGPDMALQPIYGTFSAKDYKINFGPVQMSVGSMTGDGIKGRPLSTPFAELMKHLPKPPAPGERPSPDELKNIQAFTVSIFEMYTAFAFGKIEMADFVINSAGDPATNMPAFGASIARLAMRDFGDAKIGDMTMEGLDVRPPQGKFHLGKVSLLGLGFKESLKSLSEVMGKLAEAPAGAPLLPPPDFKPAPPTLDEFNVADLDVDMMAPAPLENPSAGPTPIRFSLAQYRLQPELDPSGVPRRLRQTIDHFKIELPANTPDLKAARAAGLGKLDLSSSFDASYDAKAQQLNLGALSWALAGQGSSELTGTLDNLPAEAFQGDQFVREAAWLGAALKSVDVTLKNEGLLERIIAISARKDGKSETETRSQLIAAAAVGIPKLLGDSPAAKALANAIAKFLADPKSLHIKATSAEGIGASDAISPDHMLDKVELTATANQ